ncbi:L-lactate permease, partial [Acinetobacter nosocomialis]
VPGLHRLVEKMPPIVTEHTPYDAIYKFDWFSATGTAIFIAAVMSVIFLKMNAKQAVVTFGETLNELKVPIYSIGMV